MRDYVKYAGILFAITFVTALLLGVVNKFTAPVIEQYKVEKVRMAIESVVEGEIDISTAKEYKVNGENTVRQIVSYKNDSQETVYAVKAVSTGYAGDIEMMIGFDADCMVTGVEIVSMSETPGLGAKAMDNTEWLSQFMGKGQNELDGITGATVTSKAIQCGVDDARKQIENIAGGGRFEYIGKGI